MIDPRALLPNERICRDCGGDKFIERSGVHPSRPPGGVTAMEAPDTWREPCSTCDQTGVEVTERRAYERTASPLVEAFREVRAALDIATALTVYQAQRIDRLEEDNRRLRRVNTDQAGLLEHADMSPPSSASTPTDIRAAGGGGLSTERVS